ncbi:MAG: sodium:calcium antiporter, partial [Terriglobales bacterium]
MNIWLEFCLCAGVILYAGSQLSRHGDVIAEKTGLGGNWVGLVLLATVTSLPELITGVSAVTLNDLPDMAVSGTLGSCMFNMLVIASLDLLSKKRPVSQMVHQGHILSAGFGIVLIGFAAIDILFSKYLPVLTWLNSIDPISLAYIAVYLIAMKLIFSYERQRLKEFAGEIAEATHVEKGSMSRSVVMFTINSLLITAAACYLPGLGEQIAKTTGWGQSFIGSSFIAITTSLPEIAVSYTAARMGAFDMAVANLLGSNLFNVVILAITDFCYLKGPLLRSVSHVNTLTALTA